MASRFALAVVALVAVASQVYAAPSCGCCGPALSYPPSLSYPPAPGPYAGSVPSFSVPSSYPCVEPQRPVNQRPDVNIPLPLPAKVPLGNFCTCQKYSVKPTLIPCAAPAAPAPACFAPAPLAFPAPCAASPLGLNHASVQALLANLPCA